MNVLKKRILSVFCCLLSCLSCLSFSVSAKGGQHWYCAHVKNHARPRIDSALSYIEKYDGYYIGEDEHDKVIYLTFDAGYENGNVAKILDVLKEKQVPAAFFVLTHLVDKETALVSRMLDEGHAVCNHTAHHKDLSGADRAAFEKELGDLSSLFLEKTGKPMACLRKWRLSCLTLECVVHDLWYHCRKSLSLLAVLCSVVAPMA